LCNAEIASGVRSADLARVWGEETKWFGGAKQKRLGLKMAVLRAEGSPQGPRKRGRKKWGVYFLSLDLRGKEVNEGGGVEALWTILSFGIKRGKGGERKERKER